MNRQRARQLLAASRPDGQDASDLKMAAALRWLKRDPELARELAGQQHFDREAGAAIRELADRAGTPVDLKSALLAIRVSGKDAAAPPRAAAPAGRIVRPPFWHAPLGQDWRARAAAAAILFLLAVAGVMIARQPQPHFTDFRRDLIIKDWAGHPHLDFESSDLQTVKNWLASEGVEHEFCLPTPLQEFHLLGCRVIARKGERIPQLCFGQGARHLHLFVINCTDFPDLPASDRPDFEKCGAWKTASWRQGNNSFVLTGLKYQTFVDKFRKGGRWTMSG